MKLIRYNSLYEVITTYDIFDAVYSKRVNTIKSVSYGKNFLMAYNLIPVDKVSDKLNPLSVDAKLDESYILLLSPTGEKLNGPFKIDF